MARSSSLRSALDALAHHFSSAVLQAIRSASVDDLLAEGGEGRARGRALGSGRTAPKRTPRGRLARRSPEQITKAVDQVVALVKKSGTGLRSEEIREALRLDKRELPRLLGEGLKAKKLRKKGAKRATVYSAK